MKPSILDQVISSQKMSAISQFSPVDLSGKLFSVLSDRERDIITKRYGLSGKDKATLEEIGSTYSVTRERIRQIENSSLKKIREAFESVLTDMENLVINILEDHGEIMSEGRLVENLIINAEAADEHISLLRFLLNKLTSDRLELARESNHIYRAWTLPHISWDDFHASIDHIREIIEKRGEPMPLDELIKAVQESKKIIADTEKIEQIIVNYLDVTKKIEENRYNEWGLADWSTIRPKRMNDKIYMVLKKAGQPMHFVDIAKKINEAKFDNRVAYPATIHNELILDKKYVLVGRGIYALQEWGYKPGVVIDVIRDILKASPKPLTREEVIAEVLKKRLVKRSTVILALMNRKYFSKDASGRYQAV